LLSENPQVGSSQQRTQKFVMPPEERSDSIEFPSWTMARSRGQAEAARDQIGELFAEFRTPIYRYLYGLLQNASLAEDVTQECFLRLYTELRAGNRVDHVKAWLFRVGHNLGIDERRRYESRGEALNEEALQKPDDRAISSEDAMLQQERVDRMRAAMERLSEQQRACLLLRAENFRYREIAELLGVTKSTVFENIRRGLSRLTRDCQ
jgi:RNA polymerase sigma-70 factor (ECF subfamily)